MLNRLRVRLTLLYLLAAIFLVGTVGISSYSLMYYYFMSANDSALRYKMAMIYTALGEDTPLELQESQREWEKHQSADAEKEEKEANHSDSEEKAEETLNTVSSQMVYEGELSSIFVFPLDADGNLLLNPNPFTPPMQPDKTAVIAAKKNGTDLRTINLINGTPIRLLTYSVPPQSGFDVIQLGKPFDDQVRLLNQLLTGLITSGIIVILFLGFGSWWLAGRSLRATQRSWELQQTFIANASHELRTPLTLIRASSEVALRQTQPNSNQQGLLRDVMAECDHMSQLVEDLLLISKLDTHQLKLENEIISIPSLINEVIHKFQPLVEKQSISLTAGNLYGEIRGDRMRIRQVLIILLDNALRFTPKNGTIKISSEQKGRLVKISVQDSGKGISGEDLEHVFERFYQAKFETDMENRGNGLGLSIAKSLVEAHDGKIHIVSRPGDGTTVEFFLPVTGKPLQSQSG
jgi:signal transduction histidine kinase